MSSAILAVTQMKVRDNRDMHLYPRGKKRFTPLGILFFSAFAVSTMIGLLIENLEKLFGSSDEEERRDLLRRVFEEQPRLRGGLADDQLEKLISSYGEEESGGMEGPLVCLLLACIIIKSGLLAFCLYAARRGESEIARTVAMDHRNDASRTENDEIILGNSLVLLVVGGSVWCQNRNKGGEWLEKVDPASSLLLALYVLTCWLQTAAEQLRVLSDRRAFPSGWGAVAAWTAWGAERRFWGLWENTWGLGELAVLFFTFPKILFMSSYILFCVFTFPKNLGPQTIGV
ncbi:unnamed protein product [Durusdinium trenchii]